MIDVQIKGTNDTVQFPDGMNDDQIKQVLRNKYRPQQSFQQSVDRALTPLPNEAKPYEPSLAENTSQIIADFLYNQGIISDRYGAQQVGSNLSSVLGLLPGVGDAQAGDEFGSAVARGDVGGAFLAGAGVIPVIGDAAKAGVKGVSKSIAAKGVGDAQDYRGAHLAPDPEENAPAWDVTGGGNIYPEDFYGPQGLRFYNTHTESAPEAYNKIKTMRGNPDAEVEIYRAVPTGVNADINAGDWVAITEDYARMHGEGPLGGEYKILKKKVKAKDIYTNGDSFEEWGYYPTDQ